jgi:hypothetical protein
MSLRKDHFRGVPRKMLRLRLRIKGIKGSSVVGRGLGEGARRSESVDNMVHRLRLGFS